MDFISNKDIQVQKMLATLGLSSVDELFSAIPQKLNIQKITEDDGLSEFEVLAKMEKLAEANTFPKLKSYLGGGAYEHHVPAIVPAITAKSEFLTSYTPYQAEASQGMLQAIFEFQSVICGLTGLDVANASVYDGAAACAEACLMALREKKGRKKILLAETLNPFYKALVRQYLIPHEIEIIEVPFLENGQLDQTKLDLDEATAALVYQSPNFLGVMEDGKALSEKAHQHCALSIVAANPVAYGTFVSAKEQHADIAVGDTQPFGLALNFGGPYAGYMACTKELVRQLPGRIVGETVDTEGRRGFVLTLQAREQHIRREKATSNICTNQALAALASLIAILWYGKEGVKKLSLTNYQRSQYLKDHLSKIKGVQTLGTSETFNEFAVKLPVAAEVFRKNGIEPGIELGKWFPKLKGYYLVSVTETKTLEDLNHYIEVASGNHL